MALPTKHIRHQLPVIASLGGTALAALKQSIAAKRAAKGGGAPAAVTPPATPGAEITKTIAPRPADLVADYIRNVGGDPGAYKGVVPAHMFPQWGFPLAAKTLEGVPYPMAKVLNGGCRLEINAPLPIGESFKISARLEDVDDNGKRAVLHQRVVTSTSKHPEAVVGHMYAIVPLGAPGGEKNGEKQNGKANGNGARKPAKEVVRVPADASEIGYWKLRSDAGLAFAMLTGDFNPVHWVPAYARAFGFKSTILHGFATMARAIEGLNRGLFSGDTRRIKTFDCKFTKPLLLPNSVGLYVAGDQVFVGDAPGGSAYLAGTFTTTRD